MLYLSVSVWAGGYAPGAPSHSRSPCCIARGEGRPMHFLCHVLEEITSKMREDTYSRTFIKVFHKTVENMLNIHQRGLITVFFGL